MRVILGNSKAPQLWMWPRVTTLAAIAILTGFCCAGAHGAGMTPESPEVKKVVDAALKYLETKTHDQLGGKCLIGLAFLKADRGEHSQVVKAVAACQKTMQENPPETELDMYSNGLAIIFLCELSPQKHKAMIEWYLAQLKKRQKPHGGWGYANIIVGDTSQSQYGALAYWEANRHGFALEGPSIESFADWLLKTQDPGGCWGYQAQMPEDDKLIPQSETNCSMLAAGLGSLYICSDLMGLQSKVTKDPAEESGLPAVPSVLKPVDASGNSGGPKQYRPAKTNPAKVSETMNRAHGWMTKNYKVDIGDKRYYYLYGLERYKSFQESFEANEDKSPPWYNDGYEFLAKDQKPDGSWPGGYCGTECDTAFSVLFLLRSTQKAIRAKLGEGSLLSGRGLPTNLKRAKLRNGQLIVDQVHTKVDELLSLIDDGDEEQLDSLASDPSQIVVEQVDQKSARRLQQLVRGGEPAARMLAVRALGRTGNLDYVPTLLFALTDPDRRIVIEARDELRFISRNFDGIGPPDNFTEPQRFEAIAAWKKWYLSIRPSAILEE